MRKRVAVVAALGLVAPLTIVASSAAGAAEGPDVRISELTDGGPGGVTDTFIEIVNYGDETADLDGWSVYRCGWNGRRLSSPFVEPFQGLELEPGERLVLAHEDATVPEADIPYDFVASTNPVNGNQGFGVRIEDDERRVVDGVGIYATPTVHEISSECGEQVLPNVIDFVRAQSYQRVESAGTATDEFVLSGRTPGAGNATEPDPGVQPSDVLVSEVANGGPEGYEDDFIELANFGDQNVDVGNWEIFRCIAAGPRYNDTLQASIPDGTTIAPGEVLIVAHTSVDVPAGVPSVRYDTGLDDAGFGVMVEDANGAVVDAVGVYETDGIQSWRAYDSPCTQGQALPNRLDYGFDETYQRFQNTGDNAADFRKAERTLGELVAPEPEDEEPFEFRPIRISELTHSGPEGQDDQFFELANYGEEPVSMQGWTIYQCGADGRRVSEEHLPPLGDVVLDPGETYLAVREGSPLHRAGTFDASYDTSLSNEGFGLIVFDADGDLVDSVGIYDGGDHAGAGLGRDHPSPCTHELPAMNILDTDAGYSYQRLQSTGRSVDDFIPWLRSPGELETDLHAAEDVPAEELEPVDVEPAPRALPPSLVAPEAGQGGQDGDVDLEVGAHHTTGEDVDVTLYGAASLNIRERASRAFSGVTDQAPPAKRRPSGETPISLDDVPLDGTGDPVTTETAAGFPYQRYELLVDERIVADEIEFTWSGRSVGRNELQLYAWNHKDEQWDLLDASGGVHGGEITLLGTVEADAHVSGRLVEVLVVDGPAVRDAFSDEAGEPNLAFKHPDEYDFSLGWITDTQYITEGWRYVYADMVSWLVANQDARKIEYSFHTGDVVQRLLHGLNAEPRARDEFEFADELMSVLEDAGHPHGVIPGNHDNRWGLNNDLFNEYFPPSRYEGQPWWGDAWQADDNQNHYDVVEIGGAKFLMLYLGFFAGDEAIDWANQVIADHPDHNVIFATHEYIAANGELRSPDNGHWTSMGERYFNEVVLPNDNVFMVLAGHVHGVALNIKRDVGGVEGRVVVEMLADYQNFLGENGLRDAVFLRLLQVDLDSKRMAVNTYSPSLEEHNAWEYDPNGRYSDEDDEFTVDIDINDVYDKRVETAALGLGNPADPIGTVQVRDGGTSTVTWSDLDADTTYGWYAVAVDARGSTARSTVRVFVTEAR